MKILHVIPSLNKGGAERLVLDTCIELSKEHSVALVTFRTDNAYKFLSDQVNHIVIPSRMTPSLSGKSDCDVRELQTFINEFQPDLIHSHLFESEMVLSQVTTKASKRCVHFHDNMPQFRKFGLNGSIKRNITNNYEKKIVINSYNLDQTTFIAISKDTLTFMKTVLPKKAQMDLLTNAIDVERFKRPEGQSSTPQQLCMIGSFVPKKGQALAIQTLHELNQRGHHYTLDLLGDGPLRKDLEELVDELDLAGAVQFHGNVDHPEKFLWNTSVYLHTAKYEPLGLVLLEAMAAETPIVCTDGGGNRDLVQDGVNGFILKNRSAVELADKILQIESDADLRNKLIRNGVEKVEAFDIPSYVEKLNRIYSRTSSSANAG